MYVNPTGAGNCGFPKGQCTNEDYHNVTTQRLHRGAMIACALRETQEETQIAYSPCNLATYPNSDKPIAINYKINAMFIVITNERPNVVIDETEICEYMWLTLTELMMQQLSTFTIKILLDFIDKASKYPTEIPVYVTNKHSEMLHNMLRQRRDAYDRVHS